VTSPYVDNTVRTLTEHNFSSRIPPIENKSELTKWCAVCPKQVALCVDECSEKFHGKKIF
jgi:hypothetical protein